ncbi:hypothetical protein GCM10011380_02610 [Sphingomonas metalli]|uniref:Uncharacterized protein n=1 Tax=Sphingomonas metalli TaxID=1779358 RepID=A0A916WN25_9SPHN|nr:hypothetical protein [Sphingomonas metalli]GGB16593.1 hypothetical protein GCM10011380_02610 [Sphingomonas metalli]
MTIDQDFHQRRAAAELTAARRSRCPEAARVHEQLAALHLERLQARQPQSMAPH